MERLDKLRMPEDTRKYLKETLNPVLEDMITHVIMDKPPDPVKYMYDYLAGKLSKNFLNIKTPPKEDLAVVEENVSENSDEEEEFIETGPNSEELEYRRKPRVAVSAEAVGEWNKDDEAWVPPQHEKTAEQRARLVDMLQSSFLFSSLDKEAHSVVVDAMERIVCESAVEVITQGDDGDFLFVVDEGVLECFKKESPEAVLKTCNSGDVFGELSLLYNAPRAASVRTVTPCVLWQLGRKTFTHIVRDGASHKREKHSAFLKHVAILDNVGSYEVSQIADALVTREFRPNDTIVTEGDTRADIFYILEAGSADAFKSGFHVMNYSIPGEYFGELALIKDEPRAATVKAGPNGCTVLLLDRSAFKRLLGNLEDLLQKRYD